MVDIWSRKEQRKDFNGMVSKAGMERMKRVFFKEEIFLDLLLLIPAGSSWPYFPRALKRPALLNEGKKKTLMRISLSKNAKPELCV